jgi:hypothetical protein
MDEDIAASLEAFASRKIYAQLDPPTLRSVVDADVEQAIIDYVISKLADTTMRKLRSLARSRLAFVRPT